MADERKGDSRFYSDRVVSDKPGPVDKDQIVTTMTGAKPQDDRIKQLAIGIREEARAAAADSERLATMIKSGAEADLIRGIVARLATVNRHVELISDL